MAQEYEVISAFLDNEPFDPGELGGALAEPAGRVVLIDLIVLRGLVQARDASVVPKPAAGKSPDSRFLLAAAAAALLAFAAGYGWAERSAPESAAPPATRVVQTAGSWQIVPGGMR